MLDIYQITDTRPPLPWRIEASEAAPTATEAARQADAVASRAVIRFVAARRARREATDRYLASGARRDALALLAAQADYQDARLMAAVAAGVAARLAAIAAGDE